MQTLGCFYFLHDNNSQIHFHNLTLKHATKLPGSGKLHITRNPQLRHHHLSHAAVSPTPEKQGEDLIQTKS